MLLPEALLGDARIAGHGECWLTKSTLGFSSGEPSSRGNGSGDELGKTAERDVSHTFLLQIQQVIDDAEVGGAGSGGGMGGGGGVAKHRSLVLS